WRTTSSIMRRGHQQTACHRACGPTSAVFREDIRETRKRRPLMKTCRQADAKLFGSWILVFFFTPFVHEHPRRTRPSGEPDVSHGIEPRSTTLPSSVAVERRRPCGKTKAGPPERASAQRKRLSQTSSFDVREEREHRG